MPTNIAPTPTRARRTRVGFLLLIAALAGTGCGDRTAPTAPEAGEVAVGDGPTAVKRSRTPYISTLQVHSNAIVLAAAGGYVGLDVGLTNRGPKIAGLYLEGEVRQGSLVVSTDQMIVHCPELNGTMPHGTCTMRIELSVPPSAFTAGSAQFTLKLLKRGADNSVVTLASAGLQVTIVRI